MRRLAEILRTLRGSCSHQIDMGRLAAGGNCF